MYEKYSFSNYKNKVRGAKRKFNLIEKLFKESTTQFSEIEKYDHIHLPCNKNFIDSKKTPIIVRKKYIQLIINQVEHLINNKPKNNTKKIFASICLPWLESSCINIIPDEKRTFILDTKYQKWIPLNSNRNLINELGLILPKNLQILGRKEIIDDLDYKYKGEIWFIGELD